MAVGQAVLENGQVVENTNSTAVSLLRNGSPNASGECASKGRCDGSFYVEVSSQVWGRRGETDS